MTKPNTIPVLAQQGLKPTTPPTSCAAVSADWWARAIPMSNYLAQRAVKFGNDPDLVARTFVETGGYFSISCRVCGLPDQFCTAGTCRRCYARPDTGMADRKYGTGPNWHYGYFDQEVLDGRVDEDFHP